MGPGTLQLAGTANNLILGTTTVQQGTLLLDMTNGASGLRRQPDDWRQHRRGQRVGRAAGPRPNQIPAVDFYGTTLLTVQINARACSNLNNFTDQISNLVMIEGQTYSANVTTGTRRRRHAVAAGQFDA